MTRVLLFSSLFPNAEQPGHGIFVENRLRQTCATGEIDATVVAPVPYFPWTAKTWGRYGAFARVPSQELRSGITVHHPRFVVIPKVGMSVTPWLLYRAAKRALSRLVRAGFTFDVIDAHYLYPDGVAAALLARDFERPLVLTARGSDLNVIPSHPAARKQILWAARRADALITVSQALKDVFVTLGAPGERIAVLRNGVDTSLFKPMDRETARRDLGLKKFTLLSVGNLIPLKGHHLAIEAMKSLVDCELLIAGAGPLRQELERQAAAFGVESRIRFLGQVQQRDLPGIYNAADALVLMSEREGWANVILEAMACGTIVIATNVGGAGEIIRSHDSGRLLQQRSAVALIEEVERLRRAPADRGATRRYAEAFGWGPVAKANAALLKDAARRTLSADIAAAYSVGGPAS